MAVRLLKTRTFARYARKEGLTDEALCDAAAEVERGLVDARLGGFLIKKRVRKGSRGKSGRFRTILAHRQGQRLIFMFGFGKNEQDNISKEERQVLLKLGDELMGYNKSALSKAIRVGELLEIACDDPEQN